MEQLDLKLRLFGGQPIIAEGFDEIEPLKVGEIIRFGYSEYIKCLNLVTLTINDFVQDVQELGQDIEGLNVIDFLMAFGGEEVESQLEKTFSLFMRGEAIIDRENLQILINRDGQFLSINRMNYADIQEVIMYQNYIKNFEEKDVDDHFNPANEEARKLKERMKALEKERERIQKKQSDDKGSDDIDFFDIISSIASRSNSISELDVVDMTIYQVYRKFKRMQIIDQYDLSVKSIMAGAKDVKLNHWSSKE